MNKKAYRLVYSRFRGRVVAVAETASAAGKSAGGETCARRRSMLGGLVVAAAVAWLGAMPSIASAQIVPTPGTSTQVIRTPNGLPQVSLAKPSGSGVSVNTYNQFDVQKNGAILNNSPTLVNTQQAGYINGNPNFGPGQSARIIVNQVNSTSPSQLRGYVEVAGPRAQVVLANPAGIVVDGGGFINTSRATLTTGQPYYGADGSLAGFHVSRGLITVEGMGLNASNVDQVDLIARAVRANAAIYAKNLNGVTGTNQVDRDTLAATAIQGEGPAPGVSIDVSQLGGMYADRIVLVGTERGVGVSNQGVLAAQAGDLTLQSNGRLVLAGKTNASGDLSVSAQDGVRNSGITYGQQGVSVSTSGALTHTGTLAAQQNLNVSAQRVASSGLLGAGVNADGTVGQGGDLSVTAAGQLTATGQNVAGGNASLTGGGVDVSGSKTAANANISLHAQAG
ncbi:two-partner secretion domain-containing protein, partial [Trinickia mobilis]|uniref:two-partner secretion domain-containing protein n=1 Tax=Trinickia mobilis TaxID=2816356 RepID=UPI001A8D0D75